MIYICIFYSFASVIGYSCYFLLHPQHSSHTVCIISIDLEKITQQATVVLIGEGGTELAGPIGKPTDRLQIST